jgi:glycosyltransferase involved in cell wall biosynthesis
MKTSLICTVLNEEESIKNFLHSIISQTKNPDEVIIVDGGSSDNTVNLIEDIISDLKKTIKITVLTKKGNRSIGRNEAIKHAAGELILIVDAGCVVDKDWVKNITKPFEDPKVDVVAGYYKGVAKNIFQKCLIPYVLVMPDRIDKKNFLPASRSIAFRKSIWKKAGGFSEKLSHNEDYAFARQLKKIGAEIVFVENAIVYWVPRKNLKEAFIMFFRFALGDAESRIFRPNVLLLFLRYFIGFILLLESLIFTSYFIFNTFTFIIFLYLIWAIKKNFKYVNDWRALFILPVLQLTADFAVLLGTTIGFLK